MQRGRKSTVTVTQHARIVEWMDAHDRMRQELAHWLRERDRLGTQGELAAALGVSRGALRYAMKYARLRRRAP